MVNSRTRMSPALGLGSSRHFVWIWKNSWGRRLYESIWARARSVAASSWVIARTMSRSFRSVNRLISLSMLQ